MACAIVAEGIALGPWPQTNLTLKGQTKRRPSIPQIPFVVRDGILLEDPQEFLLERLLFVVLLLVQDVLVGNLVCPYRAK